MPVIYMTADQRPQAQAAKIILAGLNRHCRITFRSREPPLHDELFWIYEYL